LQLTARNFLGSTLLEAELQGTIFKDCSDEFRLQLDDIIELSHIYEAEDRREPLFRCEDLLVILLPLTESGAYLKKLKEASDLTTEGMAEQQLDEADTAFGTKSYSDVVAILANLVHLKDTKSPAVAHFDQNARQAPSFRAERIALGEACRLCFSLRFPATRCILNYCQFVLFPTHLVEGSIRFRQNFIFFFLNTQRRHLAEDQHTVRIYSVVREFYLRLR
jgi:hypothetical protein